MCAHTNVQARQLFVSERCMRKDRVRVQKMRTPKSCALPRDAHVRLPSCMCTPKKMRVSKIWACLPSFVRPKKCVRQRHALIRKIACVRGTCAVKRCARPGSALVGEMHAPERCKCKGHARAWGCVRPAVAS